MRRRHGRNVGQCRQPVHRRKFDAATTAATATSEQQPFGSASFTTAATEQRPLRRSVTSPWPPSGRSGQSRNTVSSGGSGGGGSLRPTTTASADSLRPAFIISVLPTTTTTTRPSTARRWCAGRRCFRCPSEITAVLFGRLFVTGVVGVVIIAIRRQQLVLAASSAASATTTAGQHDDVADAARRFAKSSGREFLFDPRQSFGS